MIDTLPREAIRQNVEDAGDESGGGVKGWFSVRVNRPCNSCGTHLEFFTINHIPGCWHVDDANLIEIHKYFEGSEVVEAPANAVPMNVLRQLETKCRRGGRS
jgi:hypothetical protein